MTSVKTCDQNNAPLSTPKVQEAASAQVETVAGSSTRAAFHPSLGMPEEELVYRVASHDAQNRVLLRVTIPPASVPLIFAHRQWRAGLVLADLIAGVGGSSDAKTPLNVRGQSVLELGCGTGIPGMVCQKLGGARKTVLTDYDSPPIVTTLKQNVRANFTPAEIKSSVHSLGFTWGTSPEDVQDALGGNGKFTRVLLADCMWDHLSHEVLVKSITQLLSRDTTDDAWVLIVSGLHTGREKIVSFIRRAARAGLILCDVDPDGQVLPPLHDHDASAAAAMTDASDACHKAHEYVYEVELADDETSDSDKTAAVSPLLDTGSAPRLTGTRRRFVIDERPEERKEVGGVHIRNRWITVWGLKWATALK